MTGIKSGDIIKVKDGFHARVVERVSAQKWRVVPIESWARTHLTVMSRDVIGIYRPLKGSR